MGGFSIVFWEGVFFKVFRIVSVWVGFEGVSRGVGFLLIYGFLYWFF